MTPSDEPVGVRVHEGVEALNQCVYDSLMHGAGHRCTHPLLIYLCDMVIVVHEERVWCVLPCERTESWYYTPTLTWWTSAPTVWVCSWAVGHLYCPSLLYTVLREMLNITILILGSCGNELQLHHFRQHCTKCLSSLPSLPFSCSCVLGVAVCVRACVYLCVCDI